MTPASETSKVLRGTKRLCAECAVRFYDLRREPIVCPACGTEHTPGAEVVLEVLTRPASEGGRSSWRNRRPKPEPVAADTDEADTAAPEVPETEEAEEEETVAPEADQEDAVVLEQESDDTDLSHIVGDTEAKEP